MDLLEDVDDELEAFLTQVENSRKKSSGADYDPIEMSPNTRRSSGNSLKRSRSGRKRSLDLSLNKLQPLSTPVEIPDSATKSYSAIDSPPTVHTARDVILESPPSHRTKVLVRETPSTKKLGRPVHAQSRTRKPLTSLKDFLAGKSPVKAQRFGSPENSLELESPENSPVKHQSARYSSTKASFLESPENSPCKVLRPAASDASEDTIDLTSGGPIDLTSPREQESPSPVLKRRRKKRIPRKSESPALSSPIEEVFVAGSEEQIIFESEEQDGGPRVGSSPSPFKRLSRRSPTQNREEEKAKSRSFESPTKLASVSRKLVISPGSPSPVIKRRKRRRNVISPGSPGVKAAPRRRLKKRIIDSDDDDDDDDDGSVGNVGNGSEDVARGSSKTTEEKENGGSVVDLLGEESGGGQSDEDDEDDDGCEICLQTTDPQSILLCDGCDHNYHTHCLKPPLAGVPEGDWFCPRCTMIQKQREIIFAASSKASEEGEEHVMGQKWAAISAGLCTVLKHWHTQMAMSNGKAVAKGSTVKSDRVSLVHEDGGASLWPQPSFLPNGLKLKSYQLVGVNYLYMLHSHGLNCILADEMGLGKTIQTVCHLGVLTRDNDFGPHLVVVPASTLSNWEREFHKWTPMLTVTVYRGTQNERMILQDELREPGAFNVLLTTYAMLNAKLDIRFFRKFPWSYIVVDEAHCLKNVNSQKYRAIAQLKVAHRLLLTGTPLQNNLNELACLLSLIMPGTREDLAELLGANNADEEGDADAVARRVKRILGPFVLRRLKSEVLDQMVPKTVHKEMCKMTKQQQEAYENVLDQTRRQMLPDTDSKEEMDTTRSRRSRSVDKPKPIQKKQMQNLVMQLRKAANHPLLHRNIFTDKIVDDVADILIHQLCEYKMEERDMLVEYLRGESDFLLHSLCQDHAALKKYWLPDSAILDSGKIRWMQTKLPELKAQGSRVLIFSQFVQVLDIIKLVLDKMDMLSTRLDGSTAVADRQQLVDAFQNDTDIFAFLLSTKAGGVGINLTGADVVIIHDIDWNPFNDRQSEDRCHRLGQTKPVKVFKMVTQDTIEIHMWETAMRKARLDEIVQTNDDDSIEGSSLVGKALENLEVKKIDMKKILAETLAQPRRKERSCSSDEEVDEEADESQPVDDESQETT